VLKVVEESYQRDDVPCGSALCPYCQGPPRLPADAPFLLFLGSSSALAAYCELLELPDVSNVVVLASCAAQASRSAPRIAQRLRPLLADPRRALHLLHDAHCAGVAACAAVLPAELPAGLRQEIAAALYYDQHLGSTSLLLVLWDEPLPPLPPLPPQVRVVSGAAAFGRGGACLPSPAVSDLFDSLAEAAAAAAAAPAPAPAITAALGEAAVEEGLAAGTLLRGLLNVSRSDTQQATVRCGALTVLLPSKAARGNAMHGDTVAVRLLGGAATAAAEEPPVFSTAPGGEGGEGGDESGVTGAEEAEAEAEAEAPACLPLAELAAVLSRAQLDIVASLSADDAAMLAGGGGASGAPARLLCVPMDRRLPLIRLRSRRGAELLGARFLLRVDGWAAGDAFPEGHLVRVLGRAGSLEGETAALLAQHGVQTAAFCPGAMAELPPAPPAGGRWAPPAAEALRRADFRTHRSLSIDPPGCTDVDDALSVGPRPDGQPGSRIAVHIADVSHFVRPGSLLDAEAASRGTTVYLVGRRYDMLPALLSEDACSLLAGCERLALSVAWLVGPDGAPEPGAPVWAGRTLIRSRHQLAYSQAQALLDGEECEAVPAEERTQLLADLRLLVAFAAAMRERREPGCGTEVAAAAGATGGARAPPLELASAEVRFTLGEDGAPRAAAAKETLPVMGVIAEAMIAANAAVASITRAAFPAAALLRRHAPPRREGLAALQALAEAGGARLDANRIAAAGPGSAGRAAFAEELARAADAMADEGAAELLRATATRAMAEAQYAACAGGGSMAHFGLGLEDYTHFTSPIRRYADIMAHRQLLAALEGQTGGEICSPAAVSARAETLNERHRAAKAAQKGCAELFFLTMLHDMGPAGGAGAVHSAVIEALLPPGLLRLFVPRFHIRAAVRLVSDDGAVRPPEGAPGGDWAAQMLFDPGPRLELRAAGGEAHSFATLQRVWVALSADGGAAHGLRLRATLLAQGHPAAEAAAAAEREELAASRRAQASRRGADGAEAAPPPPRTPERQPEAARREAVREAAPPRLSAAQLARSLRLRRWRPPPPACDDEAAEAPAADAAAAARAELEAGAAAAAAEAARPGSERRAAAEALAARLRAAADARWAGAR